MTKPQGITPDKRIEIIEQAVMETIAYSLETIGITAGSTLWEYKRQQAKDYFIQRINKLYKKYEKT